MSGLDKIIEHITQEARAQADVILSGAREEANALLSSGKKEADQMAEAIRKQSDSDVAAAYDRIKSMAELREKRIVLQAKQDRIEDVFAGAKNGLSSLGDQEYFEVIRKMLKRYAESKEGSIRFSAADLKRLPADFADTLKEYRLKISEEPADISGGFILSYGDIEDNCSFDVLLEESREELQDRIGQILFAHV